MAKFIMSIGNEAFNIIALEARDRDVTIQQLLRAVVVPEWIKENLLEQTPNQATPSVIRPSIYRSSSEQRSQMLVSPAARLRQ
jgi:hypothetical protein